jgi:hypothetical protein
MRKHILAFTFILAAVIPLKTQAQNNQFRAGVYAAGKFCQIDGDQESGFNKIGYAAGVEVYRGIDAKTSWMTGVSFAERGSKSFNTPDAPNPFPFHYRIQSAEVPVYLLRSAQLEGLKVLAGVRGSYVFNARDALGAYSNLQDELRKMLFIMGAGVQYDAGAAWLRLEFQYGLNSMRKPVSSPFFIRSGVYHNNVVFSAILPLGKK